MLCDISKRIEFIIFKRLPVIDFIADNWQLVLVTEIDDAIHMLKAEDGSHRVWRVYDENKLGSLCQQAL